MDIDLRFMSCAHSRFDLHVAHIARSRLLPELTLVSVYLSVRAAEESLKTEDKSRTATGPMKSKESAGGIKRGLDISPSGSVL